MDHSGDTTSHEEAGLASGHRSIKKSFWSADPRSLYGYDAATGQAYLFNSGLADLTDATSVTSVGSGQWESIFFKTIPEPSTALLLASGLAAMAAGRRRTGLQ